MMKFVGAALLLGYGAMLWMDVDPFSADERGRVSTGTMRRGPGGTLLWYTGFSGGK